MRNTFFVVTLSLYCSFGIVGCQSTSQLAWWKSAKKSDVESTALARTAAPQLPSEVAKQNEQLAAATTTGDEAAPFVPKSVAASVHSQVATAPTPTAPAVGYPTTNAGRNIAPAASTVANISPMAEAAASNLGSISMPYDPRAVPASAPLVAAQPSSPTVPPDRYATTSAPIGLLSNNSAQPVSPVVQKPTTGSYPATNSRYGMPAVDLATTATPANVTPVAPAGTNRQASPRVASSSEQLAVKADELAGQIATTVPAKSLITGGGNRYPITTPAAAALEVPTTHTTKNLASIIGVPAASPAAEVPMTAVAKSAPYRPGGTSSYPNSLTMQSPTQVATRPNVPTDGGNAEQSPNATAPADAATTSPPTEPSSRYR